MSLLSPKKTKIHGHRGARGIYPENSLPAIQYALETGCHAIEVDLCVTRDNQLVVHHDPVLSADCVRQPYGDWVTPGIRIRDCSLEQIRQFDIGRIRPDSAYAQQFPHQQPIDGTHIPTLEEFILQVKEYSDDVVFNIELKSAKPGLNYFPPPETYVDLVLLQLVEHRIVDRCFLQSFDWRLVCHAKEKQPSLLTGFLTDMQPDGSPISPISGKPDFWSNNQNLADFGDSVPRMIHSLGGDVWSGNYRDLTPQDIESAHDIGLDVYVWTVNDPVDMIRMIEWGVDVITTDYPKRGVDLLSPNPTP